ncbi:MAG TPA: hypothetical protein VFQ43_07905, partial [Nitrososphaera sp.]|nr:hypothetical protein [Nitrososphaera sp.]
LYRQRQSAERLRHHPVSGKADGGGQRCGLITAPPAWKKRCLLGGPPECSFALWSLFTTSARTCNVAQRQVVAVGLLNVATKLIVPVTGGRRYRCEFSS